MRIRIISPQLLQLQLKDRNSIKKRTTLCGAFDLILILYLESKSSAKRSTYICGSYSMYNSCVNINNIIKVYVYVNIYLPLTALLMSANTGIGIFIF